MEDAGAAGSWTVSCRLCLLPCVTQDEASTTSLRHRLGFPEATPPNPTPSSSSSDSPSSLSTRQPLPAPHCVALAHPTPGEFGPKQSPSLMQPLRLPHRRRRCVLRSIASSAEPRSSPHLRASRHRSITTIRSLLTHATQTLQLLYTRLLAVPDLDSQNVGQRLSEAG